MAFAFVITAAIAVIFFLLWIFKKGDSSEVPSGKHTHLTPELVKEVVRNNGFIPLSDDGNPDWIQFRKLGELYFISRDTLPAVHFLKGFTFSDTLDDINLIKKAAQMTMDKLWFGRIFIKDNEIIFRIFGMEKTVEHFTETFMDYIKLLENLISLYMNLYEQLCQEKEAAKRNKGLAPEQNRNSKALS